VTAHAGGRRRLAAVFAHPDDDTFGVGGTVALHADHADVATILATSGEAGEIARGSGATRDNLGEVREGEARAAYAALGKPDVRIEFLRYPDGGVAGVDREELTRRVTDLLAEIGPEVVVTFGPEGVTKHEDHVIVGCVGTEAFHRARERNGRPDAFRRLLYVGIPWSRIREWQRMQEAAGQEPMDPDAPFMPTGVDDDDIAVHVDTSPVAERVIAALRAHRTQATEIDEIPQDSLPEVVAHEHFVQAWPDREPGRVLSDVFEGLDRAG
jgi:LmbE family N-acetylglucosaminyl deacetylase